MTSTAEPEIGTVEPARTAVVRALVPVVGLPGFYDLDTDARDSQQNVSLIWS